MLSSSWLCDACIFRGYLEVAGAGFMLGRLSPSARIRHKKVVQSGVLMLILVEVGGRLQGAYRTQTLHRSARMAFSMDVLN